MNGEVTYWWRRWECLRCLKPAERMYYSQNEWVWKKTMAEGGHQETHNCCDGVMGFSSFIGRELPHNRCSGSSTVTCRFGPASPVLGCWTIKPDSMVGGLDSRSWKALRMRRNQQNTRKSWRIIWPGLKGECIFVRLDLFSLQDTELNTEHQEILLKENNFLSVEFKA